MTEFDLIIEATRRGFLKQVGGALAAAATSPIQTIASTAAPIANAVYDIAPIITNTNLLSEIIEGMWEEKDKEYSDEQLSQAVQKTQQDFANGKFPRSVEFYQRCILMDPKFVDHCTETMLQIVRSKDATANPEELRDFISDYMYRGYDNISGTHEEDYDMMSGYIVPKDITFNGRVVIPKDKAIQREIFMPDEEMTDDLADDIISDFENEVAFDLEQKEKANKIEDAKKSIDNTHSQLGIRRDSAWYESVLKEQDSPIV